MDEVRLLVRPDKTTPVVVGGRRMGEPGRRSFTFYTR